MMTTSTGRSVRSLATASSRYARPFIVMSLDVVHRMRPGTRCDTGIGLEHVGIDADRHHLHAIERHTEVAMDVDLRRLAHRHHVSHLPGHDSSASGRTSTSGACRSSSAMRCACSSLEPAVDADRMMDRRRGSANPGVSGRGYPSRASGCRARGRSRRGGRAARGTPASEKAIGSGKLPVANDMPSATSGSDFTPRCGACASGSGRCRCRGSAACAGRPGRRARGRAGRRRPRRGGRDRRAPSARWRT